MTIIRIDNNKNGRVFLTFDNPDESVNVLSRSVMMDLDFQIQELSKRTDVHLLVIKSAKKGVFIAGADISEFSSIITLQTSQEVCSLGQSIFSAISKLPFTTVAAIQGVCLGGGLELALACDFRICSDADKVLIGLPEVNLGIIPGWGGTQRLPRLIGLEPALDMILSGKTLNGPSSLKKGIVDACVSETFFDEKLSDFLLQIEEKKGRRSILGKRKKASFLSRFIFSRVLIKHFAKKSIIKKTGGHYPAPLAALTAVISGFPLSLKKGLKREFDAFSPLPLTQESRHLVRLFFTQESLKKYTGVVESVSSTHSIHQVTVLGAGLMGGGIAWLFSYRDFQVRLKDLGWEAIGKAYEAAKNVYSQLIKKRKITPSQVDQKMLKIGATLGYDGLQKSDLIVEAIVENMKIKKEVLKDTETHIKASAILASNTSSLSITEMAADLSRPENFVGMHFFSPVNRMPLVEVIPGEKTSKETIVSIVSLVKKLKKTPIVVKNCPGFLVNRILIPYVNEAVLCLQDGAKITDVDAIMTRFGMPIGPLALADEVGLDVGYKVATILEDGYGKRMAVSEGFSAIMKEASLRGKKTGKGFYIHSGSTKKENPDIYSKLGISPDRTSAISREDIRDRLVLSLVNEASRCLEESVVDSPNYLDMAMILGTGFPPFRGGVLAYADSIGSASVAARLSELATMYGERFTPSSLCMRNANENKSFYTEMKG